RVESCLGISGWELAGSGTAQADLRGSAANGAFEFEHATADFTQVQLRGNGYAIAEPALDVTLTGKCDFSASAIEITQAKLSTGPSTAIVNRAVVKRDASELLLDVDAELSADLNELCRWAHDARKPPTFQVSGKLTGKAHLKSDHTATVTQLDG